jgi:predicted GIY-YIG superfamily endonuclease
MTVYLLHFTKPYRHARHYLGYAGDLAKRLNQHRHGAGARLPQVCAEHGIDFVVARTWPGGRDLERRLKLRKNSPKLCPICAKEIESKGRSPV